MLNRTRIKVSFLGLALAGSFSLTSACAEEQQNAIPKTEAPENARVYFISPQNNATVQSPVKVQFGLEGMGIAPAGIESEMTGHHHLILNAPLPPLENYVPVDDNHIHFGGGQTEVTIELPPGEHTLQLLLADHNHLPHEPTLSSEQIRITVTP